MDFDEAGVREFLSANNWPHGLIEVLINGLRLCPIRFFICDDSGSMQTNDGEMFTKTGAGKFVSIQCSRWKELTQTLLFHLNLTKAARVESEFRLLNGITAVVSPNNPAAVQQLTTALSGSPSGGTPLCSHIREVTQKIQNIAPILKANGQKAVIVIATDGESSDGDIREALKPLKDLPVWVVVRLCTNDDAVVNYWSNIDNELELDMDVLDDIKGEASEITEKNPWITYGEPLHRLREFGITTKDLDLLDEAKLTPDQVRDVVGMIFGSKDQIPHPQIEFERFCKYVDNIQAKFTPVFDPVTKKGQSWIKVSQFKKQYGAKGGCTMM